MGYWETEWRGERSMRWAGACSCHSRERASRARGLRRPSRRRERRGSIGTCTRSHWSRIAVERGLCRTLGFTLVEECDGEYPPGNPVRCNDWRLDLFASGEQNSRAACHAAAQSRLRRREMHVGVGRGIATGGFPSCGLGNMARSLRRMSVLWTWRVPDGERTVSVIEYVPGAV